MVRRLLRIGTSALFLCALVWLLDAEALATRLAALRPRWALLAVGLSVPQMALMAFRWRLTAGRLGARPAIRCSPSRVLPGHLPQPGAPRQRDGRRFACLEAHARG